MGTVPLSTLDFSMTITGTPKSVNIRGSFSEWLSSMNNLAMNQKNILGGELEPCSFDPLTGWFRDGYCRQDDMDHGSHTVCAEVTQGFLEYTKARATTSPPLEEDSQASNLEICGVYVQRAGGRQCWRAQLQGWWLQQHTKHPYRSTRQRR